MLEKLTKKQKQWIEKTIYSLSLTEKIGQMVNITDQELMKQNDSADYLKRFPVGSIFVGSEIIDTEAAEAGRAGHLQTLVDNASPKIPMLYSGDFESGIGAQIKGFTEMTRTMGLAASFSSENSYDYGKIIGSEGHAINIRWGFGPVSDLNINRENPVTNIRSAGETPENALPVLKNIIKGMQDCGCAACAKHFPGDGTDTRDQHMATSLNLLSMEDWELLHGRVFRELIDAGVMSMMIGHIGFPAYEEFDEQKGKWRPATCSHRIVTSLLREKLGFDGIVISDALCMIGYKSWGSYEERIIDTVNSGIDILLWPEPERFFPLMLAALKDGRVAMEKIDTAVRRILAFKALLGLWSGEKHTQGSVDLPRLLRENGERAAQITEGTITLMRNRENLLPLHLEKNSRILVFLSPDLPAVRRNLARFTDGLSKRGYRVTTAVYSDFAVLADVIYAFDCVFYLSDANPQYNHHRDVSMLQWELIGNEDVHRMIWISLGSPYHLYDVPGAATYVNAYHDGLLSVDATLKALFGEIPFQGRSPVSVPYCFKTGDGIVTQ